MKKAFITILIFIFPFFSLAKEKQSDLHIGSFISAKSIKKKKPKYPKNAMSKRQEGWVIINFIIDKEGNVISPEVAESSGFTAFENAALRAVKSWKYEPATQNGKPVEQSKTNVKFDFHFTSSVNVTEDFYMTYRELISAIKSKDLKEAKELLEEIENGQIWNHTESSFYWLADAIYAEAVGDSYRELNSVNRALVTNNEKFKNANVLYLRNRQFILNVTYGYFRDAIKAYQKLRKLPDSDSMVAEFKPYYKQLLAGIKGSDPLIRDAIFFDSSRIWHRLSRDSFTLSVKEGKVEDLEIRCDAKFDRYKFAEKMEWKIPASWGRCVLLVWGELNTKMEIIETVDYVKRLPRKKKA